MPKKKIPAKKPIPEQIGNIDVDRFDHPFHRSIGAVGVLQALANGCESEGGDHDDQRMWSGLRQMAETMANDLETMNEEYTAAANYIYNLEHGGSRGKGETLKDRRAARKDGAR